MFKKLRFFLIIFFAVFLITGCELDVFFVENNDYDNDENIHIHEEVTLLDDLVRTDYFRHGALEHILEGELNRRGQAVGYHYDQLPTKKGKIIEGTKTEPDEYGVFEAKIEVEGIAKKSNQGKSTFFPDEWDTQEIVDAINEVYENREHLTGNTYGGLTSDGVQINMYLDDHDLIISAFPIYEGR